MPRAAFLALPGAGLMTLTLLSHELAGDHFFGCGLVLPGREREEEAEEALGGGPR